MFFFFFFQAEDGIRDVAVTGVQTCALPISAPKGTPRNVIDWLHSEVVRALSAADVRERFDALGAEPSGISPEEFAKVLRDDARRWAEVIRAAGIKAE